MLKSNVLRRQADFDLVYNRGKSVGDRYVVLFYKKNGLSFNRTGFLASKKVGNSVLRNRARRLMKESYREFCSDISDGFDFVVIARNTINDKKCQEVSKSLKMAFKRAGLFKENKEKEG